MHYNSEKYLVEHYSALEDFKRDFRNANLFTLAASYIKGNRIADIGCGAGFFAKHLTAQNKMVVGIEPNPGMRDLALRLQPDLSVVLGTAEEVTTLLTEPVDCVTMLDVLEHIENDQEQVKKVHTVLNANGQFIIVVPAYPSLYGIRDKAMGHYRRYTKKGLVTLLKNNGFEVEHVRYWNMLGVLPYLVSEKVLKKPLQTSLRTGASGKKTNVLRESVWHVVNSWMKYVENQCNLGFGLSIVCVARKSGLK